MSRWFEIEAQSGLTVVGDSSDWSYLQGHICCSVKMRQMNLGASLTPTADRALQTTPYLNSTFEEKTPTPQKKTLCDPK